MVNTDAESFVNGDREVEEIVRKLIKEGRGSLIVILAFLCKAGKATLSDIQRALAEGKYRAQYNWTLSNLNELKELGLVYEEQIQIKGKLKVRIFDLTEKGKKVSERICQILNI